MKVKLLFPVNISKIKRGRFLNLFPTTKTVLLKSGSLYRDADLAVIPRVGDYLEGY